MDKTESEYLLRDCRELLTGRMRSPLSRMLGDVEDVLFDMATGMPASGQDPDYIDAVREIRMKKREIRLRFENRLLEQFDTIVKDVHVRTHASGTTVNNGGDKVRVITVSQTRPDPYTRYVEKMRDECRLALTELDKHVSSLMRVSTMDRFINPLAPVTVFNAFRDSCCDIHVGEDVHQILLDRFDRHIGPVLQCIYRDLNRLFQRYQQGDLDLSMSPEETRAGRTSLLVGNWIREKVMAQIGAEELPGFVREFLLGVWTRVLERVYAKDGENSPEWQRAMQVIPDLQDSIRRNAVREARKQQIWILPGLTYRLKNGMKTVAIPLKQQAEFLSQLKAYHARITESGMAAGKPG